MGLILSVYRTGRFGDSDCTMGGVSSKFHEVTVINAEGPFEPDESRPAVILEAGPIGSIRLVPKDVKDSGKWYMDGGNFAYASDARFGEAVAKVLGTSKSMAITAVPIHDRVEWKG